MVVMLRQCCCGCSLGTGTIIIGIIEAVGGIVSIIANIVGAAEAESEPKAQSILDALDTVRVTHIILAVLGAFLALLGILLIVGARINRPSYLVPWMICTCFFTFANIVTYVINTAAYIEAEEGILAGINVAGAIINVVLQIYFLLVVYSLYRELRGEDLLDL